MKEATLKSLMLLINRVLDDLGARCGTSTTFDMKTIERRFENEGLSFLAITLPNFCKDFQKSLDQGFVSHDQYTGFARNGGLPRFLGGFLDQIFDRSTGRLINDPEIDAIYAVRQITLLCSKILVPCSDERVQDAIQGYIDCEQSVKLSDASLKGDDLDRFKRLGHLIFRDLFTAVDSDIYYSKIIPRHGPGTTQDRTLGNKKYRWRTWTDRLEHLFPAREHLFSRIGLSFDGPPVGWLEPGAEPPVRVITVPKTLKTPRIIAVEPVHMQYMQQAIMLDFVKRIEEDYLSSSFIRFLDQEPNQRLAWRGSLLGDLATLDLSEASDRVSNQLVRALFSRFPHLAEAVDATRTRKADVDGHGVIRLAKFASMGSALCFPVESMVFMTVIFCGIEKQLNRQLTRKDIESFMGSVRTYGDDIIVPVSYVRSVVSALSDFGLKVNTGKSYWTGKFRESCGKDFYAGFDVSVVKVRREIPTRREQSDELVSAVSLRNQLFEFGFWSAVEFMDKVIMDIIPFPFVHPNSPALGRFQDGHLHDVQRWDPRLQRPLVKAAVVDAPLPHDELDGVDALAKVLRQAELQEFLKGASETVKSLFEITTATDHLRRAGRPRIVRTKTRWVSPL